MRVILLRPPRYVWPFNSETSAFWQPLGLLCLAGHARREMPELSLEVWDCPGERIGWRTLQQRLGERRIDVLGIGEETVSAHEGVRAARIVRRLWPECLNVAGGVYFAHAIEPTLELGCIDAIVRGEGEVTFVELLRAGRDRAAWAKIPGLAYRDPGGATVVTPRRPLIADMDSLPFPAYDLLDMSCYGRGSRNHPDLVSIEHSRGCVDRCNFCILWKHMGESVNGHPHPRGESPDSPRRLPTGVRGGSGDPPRGTVATSVNGNGQVRPSWRTKSPGRSFEEVRRLYREFGRRTFGWVDPTFNVSPRWSDEWAELVLRSELVDSRGRAATLHTAWLRADGVLRDEHAGVLEKLVRAGLRQVMIGVERDDPEGLAYLGKHDNGPEICRQAFAIFRRKYPQVYTIGTMIFGLPSDTRASLARLRNVEYEMGMDYCFLMPLTPNPGTEVESLAIPGALAVGEHLSRYNFHTPVVPTESLSTAQLESLYWRIMFNPNPHRLVRGLRQALRRDRRKRRVFRALLGRGTAIATRSLLNRLLHRRSTQPLLHSRKPPWYEN